MNWLKNLLASQGFHSFYHAVLAGVVGYITANGVNSSKAWISGLVTAVIGAWVGWYNGSPAGTNPAVTPSAPAAQGTKIGMFFLAFLLMASSAMAWDFPKNSVKLAPKLGAVLGETVGAQSDIFAAVPYFSGNFKFSIPTLAGSGGLGLDEAIGIFRVSPNTDGTVNVNPQLFLGVGLHAYPGQFLENNLSGAVPVDFGIELGVPTIQGVGSFTVGYDFSDQKVTVSGTAPLDVLSGGLIHTFFNL